MLKFKIDVLRRRVVFNVVVSLLVLGLAFIFFMARTENGWSYSPYLSFLSTVGFVCLSGISGYFLIKKYGTIHHVIQLNDRHLIAVLSNHRNELLEKQVIPFEAIKSYEVSAEGDQQVFRVQFKDLTLFTFQYSGKVKNKLNFDRFYKVFKQKFQEYKQGKKEYSHSRMFIEEALSGEFSDKTTDALRLNTSAVKKEKSFFNSQIARFALYVMAYVVLLFAWEFLV